MLISRLIRYSLIAFIVLSFVSLLLPWGEPEVYSWGNTDNFNIYRGERNYTILYHATTISTMLLPIYAIALYIRGKSSPLQASILPIFSLISTFSFFIYNQFFVNLEYGLGFCINIITITIAFVVYVLVDISCDMDASKISLNRKVLKDD